MRWGLIWIAAAACASWSVSAQAQQTVSTGTSTIACYSDECFEFDTYQSALAPFNSSLGELTGVTLYIDATSHTLYDYNLPFTDPNPSAGSAQLAYEGLFDAVVNGVSYSVGISGSQSVALAGDPNVVSGRGELDATGSATFVLDSSLFSTFIDKSDLCHSGAGLTSLYGVCVTAQASPNDLNSLIVSNDNLVFSQTGAPPYTWNEATYGLIYSYIPFADLPEPSTWMMMLLGFGAIGMAARRTRYGWSAAR